jgi:hypothetical protein
MFCNFQTKRSIISKDVLFCLVYLQLFFWRRKSRNNRENRIFNGFFFAFPSSSRTGVSVLKASEMAAVWASYVYDLRTNILFFLLNKPESTIRKNNCYFILEIKFHVFIFLGRRGSLNLLLYFLTCYCT